MVHVRIKPSSFVQCKYVATSTTISSDLIHFGWGPGICTFKKLPEVISVYCWEAPDTV